ncbi:MAG: hypothetical protein N4A57_12300 [Anaeromicrobium sp.]|jgi:hypothetical protein|uniref:hypothetical protein n=1 Tax=Anaeromicrobium sp. TaxID=1929132 RepID=UPI0025E8F921|nr:hypothetical protein [Anaeromicrobium sp.]MCT4595033.1 hypothetical protein [Anaeromicrobium sp.]
MEASFSNKGKILEDKILEPNPYTSNDKKKEYNVELIENENFLNEVESVGVLLDKVYSFCQLRDCFPKFKIDIHDFSRKTEFVNIIFQEGYIERGTLEINSVGKKRPNFSRIKFTLKIPFTLSLRNLTTKELISMNGILPELQKDIIMYIPEARNEFDFRVVAETRTEILSSPEIINNQIEIPIGIFSIIRVVGRVQLLVPAYKVTPEPPDAETYEDMEGAICEAFDSRNFPKDFFPIKDNL